MHHDINTRHFFAPFNITYEILTLPIRSGCDKLHYLSQGYFVHHLALATLKLRSSSICRKKRKKKTQWMQSEEGDGVMPDIYLLVSCPQQPLIIFLLRQKLVLHFKSVQVHTCPI